MKILVLLLGAVSVMVAAAGTWICAKACARDVCKTVGEILRMGADD